MLSSPDRDDDLLQERLRALHDTWPGDPADDDPLHDARRQAEAGAPPRLIDLVAPVCRAIGRRLGASATGLPLPPAVTPRAATPAADDDAAGTETTAAPSASAPAADARDAPGTDLPR
ncbi:MULTISPECIES: hypothetical protein [unclassified Clavibacter]|uniref:hypothetical protein n=1 Tax=unclassified Clavibacter TaxID=2626594 RepID=UPI0022EA1314|nr:hypothetical protein [Clavibacter sp. CT19]MDA3804887.1 hypothetical protein [Clavibacter sp. CT19]